MQKGGKSVAAVGVLQKLEIQLAMGSVADSEEGGTTMPPRYHFVSSISTCKVDAQASSQEEIK